MTLNYKQTCRLFAWSLYSRSETANVPDFWEDAFDNQIYSDTEYSNMRTWFLGCLAELPNNLSGTLKDGVTTYQITTSEISSDSAPPSR